MAWCHRFRQQLEVKGINGEIRVEPSTGADVQVSARITLGEAIRIRCVSRSCRVAVIYVFVRFTRLMRVRSAATDVETFAITTLHFTVRLPRGVKLKARTVNGEITARGCKAHRCSHREWPGGDQYIGIRFAKP